MIVDMDLSHTTPLSYSVDRLPVQRTVPRAKVVVKPYVDSANVARYKDIEKPLKKIHNEALMMFDISGLAGDILSGKEGICKSLTTYKKLGKIIDFSNYLSVNKETISSIEDTTITLDDTIDELEDIIDSSSFGFNKFIMNLDLNRALTLQFILSNKVADYYSENYKNQSV